jgi:hypothetical protein
MKVRWAATENNITQTSRKKGVRRPKRRLHELQWDLYRCPDLDSTQEKYLGLLNGGHKSKNAC